MALRGLLVLYLAVQTVTAQQCAGITPDDTKKCSSGTSLLDYWHSCGYWELKCEDEWTCTEQPSTSDACYSAITDADCLTCLCTARSKDESGRACWDHSFNSPPKGTCASADLRYLFLLVRGTCWDQNCREAVIRKLSTDCQYCVLVTFGQGHRSGGTDSWQRVGDNNRDFGEKCLETAISDPAQNDPVVLKEKVCGLKEYQRVSPFLSKTDPDMDAYCTVMTDDGCAEKATLLWPTNDYVDCELCLTYYDDYFAYDSMNGGKEDRFKNMYDKCVTDESKSEQACKDDDAQLYFKEKADFENCSASGAAVEVACHAAMEDDCERKRFRAQASCFDIQEAFKDQACLGCQTMRGTLAGYADYFKYTADTLPQTWNGGYCFSQAPDCLQMDKSNLDEMIKCTDTVCLHQFMKTPRLSGNCKACIGQKDRYVMEYAMANPQEGISGAFAQFPELCKPQGDDATRWADIAPLNLPSQSPGSPTGPTASPGSTGGGPPTSSPTTSPTTHPTRAPSISPYAAGAPSGSPVIPPTPSPTTGPTTSPTKSPDAKGSPAVPTKSPDASSTGGGPPTMSPSMAPTTSPTMAPTASPYAQGTPSKSPANPPPTKSPTVSPSASPGSSTGGGGSPTSSPTTSPSMSPNVPPSFSPYTPGGPSGSPASPTKAPTAPPTAPPVSGSTGGDSPSSPPATAPSNSPKVPPTYSPYTPGTPSKSPVSPTVSPTAPPASGGSAPTKSPKASVSEPTSRLTRIWLPIKKDGVLFGGTVSVPTDYTLWDWDWEKIWLSDFVTFYSVKFNLDYKTNFTFMTLNWVCSQSSYRKRDSTDACKKLTLAVDLTQLPPPTGIVVTDRPTPSPTGAGGTPSRQATALRSIRKSRPLAMETVVEFELTHTTTLSEADHDKVIEDRMMLVMRDEIAGAAYLPAGVSAAALEPGSGDAPAESIDIDDALSSLAGGFIMILILFILLPFCVLCCLIILLWYCCCRKPKAPPPPMDTSGAPLNPPPPVMEKSAAEIPPPPPPSNLGLSGSAGTSYNPEVHRPLNDYTPGEAPPLPLAPPTSPPGQGGASTRGGASTPGSKVGGGRGASMRPPVRSSAQVSPVGRGKVEERGSV
eukprot:Hpha_TRINITY_DN11942_c0_g1::TRINITY_DN11942_c0_g1_i1::g.20454::m.20454